MNKKELTLANVCEIMNACQFDNLLLNVVELVGRVRNELEIKNRGHYAIAHIVEALCQKGDASAVQFNIYVPDVAAVFNAYIAYEIGISHWSEDLKGEQLHQTAFQDYLTPQVVKLVTGLRGIPFRLDAGPVSEETVARLIARHIASEYYPHPAGEVVS